MPPITPRLTHMSEHLAAMEFGSTVCLAKKQRDQTGSSRSLPSRLEKTRPSSLSFFPLRFSYTRSSCFRSPMRL